MGFWGTYLVLRSDRPALHLDGLRDVTDEDVLWRGAGPDGWQVVRLFRDSYFSDIPDEDVLRRRLTSLMDQTGNPVLAAAVLDSDGALLTGYSPRAGRWRGWLMLERIVPHFDSDAFPDIYEDEDGEICSDEGEEYQRRFQRACDRLYAQVAPRARDAAPRAAAWAAEAGCTTTVAAVHAALDGEEVFAEEQFFTLLDALGIPALSDAEPDDPPADQDAASPRTPVA